MSDSTLYTCSIVEQTEDEAFVQIYWTRADHIGTAIEQILSAARLNGLQNPEAAQLDPYDMANLECEVEPGPDSPTFWATARCYFPPGPSFILPYGIIGSCIEGEHDIDEITSGYTRTKDKEGKTTIEINVERDSLMSLYEHLLNIRQSYRVFWYLLHEHWDDSNQHFFVNESLDTPQSITAHLRDNKLDSLMNGYVTLTSYCAEGSTNLNISDHKRIVVLTYSDEMADDYAKALKKAGYDQAGSLVSMDKQIHHWHYRHPNSRSRAELTEHLHVSGFRDWNRE